MTTQTDEAFDLDAILDGTLDNLADIPEFAAYPPGSYLIDFSLEQDKNKKAVFYGRMKVREVKELADPALTPPTVGAETGTRFDLTNEFGQGNMKKVLSAAAAKFGKKSNRELIEDLKNPVEALVITDQRPNRDKTVFYTNIVEIMIT